MKYSHRDVMKLKVYSLTDMIYVDSVVNETATHCIHTYSSFFFKSVYDKQHLHNLTAPSIPEIN